MRAPLALAFCSLIQFRQRRPIESVYNVYKTMHHFQPILTCAMIDVDPASRTSLDSASFCPWLLSLAFMKMDEAMYLPPFQV